MKRALSITSPQGLSTHRLLSPQQPLSPPPPPPPPPPTSSSSASSSPPLPQPPQDAEEETDDVPFVRRFVPDIICTRLAEEGAISKQEIASYEHTIVGFFDVSGFSNLARQLEETEKRALERNKTRKRNASNLMAVSGKGAEELVKQLNDTLQQLIAVIRSSGGDIIKFAGDAILVVWLCDSRQELREQACIATECAVRCCALRSDSGLGLHVGIGAGQLVGAHVGGKFGRWEYFIAGEACTQSARAESYSKLDQVVLSSEAFALVQEEQAHLPILTYERLQETTSGGLQETSSSPVLVKSLLVSNELLARARLSRRPFPVLSEQCAKMAEAFVPGPVKEALKSATIVPGGPRKLTVIFFLLLDVNLPSRFDDGEDDSKQRFLQDCQSQAFSVQDSAYHYWATLRQFILDDKGFVAIVCLGLPPFFHEDNAVRACKVARRLLHFHKVKAAAGICTGTVFCGIVGSSKRAEYSVAGSCINLAARLMCKAKPGEIWVDAQTRQEAQSQLSFEKMPSLAFKGFDKPVDIYQPVFPKEEEEEEEKVPTTAAAPVKSAAPTPAAVAVPVLASHKAHALVGMDRPIADLSRLLLHGDDAAAGPRIALVEGEAGAGKTRLVEWAVQHSSARRTLVSAADASEIHTPFYVWRAVLQMLLSVPAPTTTATPQLPPPVLTRDLSMQSVVSVAKAGQATPPSTAATASSFSDKQQTAPTRKFFPSAFRSAANASSSDSLAAVSPSASSASILAPGKKKLVSDKRRSSTESVSSLRRASSEATPQQTLDDMLQSVIHVSRVDDFNLGDDLLLPPPASPSEAAASAAAGLLLLPGSQQLQGIAEDAEEEAAAAAAAAAVAPSASRHKAPYLVDRVLQQHRGGGASARKLVGALQQILPNLPVLPVNHAHAHADEDEGDASPEDLSPQQLACEMMLLLLEELAQADGGNSGNGGTLVVFDNAQSMDKASWDLLYKVHCSSSSTASSSKVRFLVAYRPFDAMLDHPLTLLLNHHHHHQQLQQQQLHASTTTISPMRRVSSSIKIPPTAATATTTASSSSQQQQRSSSALSGSPLLPMASLLAPPQRSASSSAGQPSQPPPPTPQPQASSSLLGKTFHRFGDAKPFRARHGSVTSLASGVGGGGGGGGMPFAPTTAPVLSVHEDVIRITIPPLTLRETSLFLSNHFHVSTGPRLLAFLRNTSKGNPRALLDCYRALQDQALVDIDPESGIAEENTSLEDIGDLVFAIPQHVRAKLQQQFDQLPMPHQLLLKLASVVGGAQVSLSLLRQLCAQLELHGLMPIRTGLDVDAGLRALREHGLLRPVAAGAVDHENGDSQEDEEVWSFANDNTRFIVYSQMLHTFRCQVHSQVLDVFKQRPLAYRLREDPCVLGNHAIGAERPQLAFQCFHEAMRRAVLQDAGTLDLGRRLWQSCNDVLDGACEEQQQQEQAEDGDAQYKKDTPYTLSLRVCIEVLLGQIAVNNCAWDEAKLSLTRALDKVDAFNVLAGTSIPTTTAHQQDGKQEQPVDVLSCLPFALPQWIVRRLRAASTPSPASPSSGGGGDVLRDPLEEEEDGGGGQGGEPSDVVMNNARLALELLERIAAYERECLAKANSIRTFSEHELGKRIYF